MTGQHWQGRRHDPGGGSAAETPAAVSATAVVASTDQSGTPPALRNARTDGVGSRTASWRVSVPVLAHKTGSCKVCHEVFAMGEPRAAAAGSQQRTRFVHPHCVPGGLGPSQDVEGLTDLPPDAQLKVKAQCDLAGVTREEYQQTKRRRRATTDAGTASSQRHGFLEDDAFQEQKLCNLEWWDDIDHCTPLQQWVPTISTVPPQLQAGIADARAAVLVSMVALPPSACSSAEAHRLEKLLTYMDRLLLCREDRQRDSRGPRKKRKQQSPLTVYYRQGSGSFGVVTGSPYGQLQQPQGRAALQNQS